MGLNVNEHPCLYPSTRAIKLVRRIRESVGAARQVLFQSLVYFVERLILSQRILILVVAGFEPTTIRFADGSIPRHAIWPVGQLQKPSSNTIEKDKK